MNPIRLLLGFAPADAHTCARPRLVSCASPHGGTHDRA